MEIRWLGHACFVLTSETGTKVMTDPFDEAVGYRTPREAVNIVTVSHDHHDHNAVGVLPGKPAVIKTAGKHEVEGITLEGFSTFHDANRGANRGGNLMFLIIMDGLRIVHCGDLGHQPDRMIIEALKPVDLLMVPVGSVYTIDAAEAHKLAEKLQPRVILPMHYQTPRLKFHLEPLENFTRHCSKLKRLEKINLTRETLPADTETIVLEYPE